MINVRKTALVLSLSITCAIGEIATRQFPVLATPTPEATLAQLTPNETENSQNTQSDPSVLDFQPASREKIEELITLVGADTTYLVLEQMITQFRTFAPEVPDEWWDGFIEKAIATDFSALLFPIYERNYTAAEVDGLIDFYQSPLGQSLLEKAPIVAQESLAVGQAWGLGIAQELVEELEADGFDLPRSVSIPETSTETESDSQLKGKVY
ncbi:MAG: DUF2059 domain-containing protein [Cyanobacteria bacterium J06650_10]